MSGDEFLDWMAYYQLDPFGNWRADTQAALVASTIANVNAKKGKHYNLKDFQLEFKPRFAKRRQRVAMSGDQVLEFFQGLATRQQGRA